MRPREPLAEVVMKGWKKVDMHKLQDLVRLLRMGKSQRQSARLLSMGRNTVL